MAFLPDLVFFQLRRTQDFKIDGVIEVVAVVSDLIRKIRDLRLKRCAIICLPVRHLERVLVFPQAFADFERQIETRKIRIRRFEQFHHARTLAVVIEATVIAHAFGEHFFPRVAEGRVPQIVRKRDGFGKIFVQA